MSTQERFTVSVIDLIDQLEGLFVNGRRIVFTPNVLVNEDEALDLIDRARTELPDEIKQARWTLDQQQQLLEEAEATATRLVEEAQARAARLVADAGTEAERIAADGRRRAEAAMAEHEVTRAAREQAEGIVAEAEEQAATVLAEADAYARDVMERLEAQLVKTVGTVRKGIESLPAASERRGRKR